MTVRDPDARYERAPQAIPFAIQQWVREHVHTCEPGIVQSYDPATKRARVQPALRRLIRLEQGGDITRMDKALILDVPVRQVATGGYLQHQEILEGDVVLLLFTHRGLEHFKASWGEISDPPVDAFFDAADAVAIPWGSETIQPVRATGWLVQGEDGQAYVSLDSGVVRIVTGTSRIEVHPDRVEIHVDDSDNVHLGGTAGQELATKRFVAEQYNAHTHSSPMGPHRPTTQSIPPGRGE